MDPPECSGPSAGLGDTEAADGVKLCPAYGHCLPGLWAELGPWLSASHIPEEVALHKRILNKIGWKHSWQLQSAFLLLLVT